MFDDLDDLLEDVPQQNKSKGSSSNNNTAGTKLVSQVGLANKRHQTVKANDEDFDWGEGAGVPQAHQ